MPGTMFKKEKPPRPPAEAPNWQEFTKAKDVLEALWQYMDDNSHFGAVDTEPKYDVLDAIRKFERVPETQVSRWELYSTLIGVGKINQQIAKAINVAIARTKEQGFGAKALAELWADVVGYI